ncbi:MAG: ABC transporter permease subunit [Lachnospiraceae bacterium]|nr:ABC transporter permease subunit [Lachnospiraceae bacterium]
MTRLYKEELKRVLRTRSTLLFLAAAVVLSIFMAYMPVTYVRFTYEENGQEMTIKGREALAIRKELQSPNAGEVTPEKMAEGLHAYQKNLEIYGDFYGDFPRNVHNSEIFPWSPQVSRLREVMADSESGLAPDYMEMTEEDALNFYERCRTHLTDLMKLEQRKNPQEQQIAAKMYDKVTMPFYYYPGYDSNMFEYEGIYLFVLMFLCVMVTAPLFSCEYQTGADDILRSTRHGRRNLAFVKILSALTISIVMFVLCMAIFMVISNSLFGWECRQTSMQILFSASTLLGLNMGQLQNLVMLAGFIALLACVSFILFVSSACRNTTISTGLTIAFVLFPSVFYMMIGNTLSAYLRVLFPSGALGGSNSFGYAVTYYFEFLKFGPLTVWTPWLLMIVPAIEIPIFLWLTVQTYCRRSM